MSKRILSDLIGAVVFLTDTAWSMVFSTLSQYAVALNASLALIGTIFFGLNLSRMLLGLPRGALSDRIGRRAVIITGLIAFLLGVILLIVVFEPLQLVLAAMLIGVGISSIFPVGLA
jgi:MFS family permease